ncbi:MAG TPA: outer membrane lipoprotein carrier protein LolA [Conexibacter sp.]|nr:outer membrane lipoprotein carrier protein LolA [Conexibacter sp.]
MRWLRTISTGRLVVLAVTLVVLGVSVGIAQAALRDGPKPAPKPLDVAVHDALTAPTVPGVTARVHFTNHLLPSGALPDGMASPLLAGASGRLWIAGDGRFRVELQSNAGDAQIVSDGTTVTLYDASTNTAYRLALPQRRDTSDPDTHTPPTLAQIDRALARIGERWSLSGATPSSVAGEPAYTVRIAPKQDGGLFGAAELAWDASNGVPLRAAIYAAGQSDPVFELTATDVSFGRVATSDIVVPAPAGARVVDLSPSSSGHDGPDMHAKPVTGVAAVQAALPFTLAAPDQLAGQARAKVWLAGHGANPAAVVTYGRGLGGIVVVERKAKPGEQPFGSGGGNGSLRLPAIGVNGAPGRELATALGTVLSFQRGGIDYVVAGSIPAHTAETAARQLG